MIGQGRPRRFLAALAAAALTVALAPRAARPQSEGMAPDPPSQSAGQEVRLRIAFGGGAPRRWRGSITVDRGSFSELKSIGVEPGAAAAIAPNGRTIVVDQPTERSYDGVDAMVAGSPDARISILLSPMGELTAPAAISFTLAELYSGVQTRDLDGQGNRLVVERSPGDSLRVRFSRPNLVFSPRETFTLEVEPHLPEAEPATALLISVELVGARGGATFWSKEFDVKTPSDATRMEAIPLSIELPAAEGAYDLRITARRWGFRQRYDPTKRLAPGPPLASRAVQLLVLADQPPPSPSASAGQPFGPTRLLAELDPANPRWWRRFVQLPQLTRMPGVPQGPWDDGRASTWNHPHLGRMTQLAVDGWAAYPLPIDDPGAPHVLEVDYPSDMPQSLGISIVEPNAAGEVTPIGLDSGFYLSQGEAAPSAVWRQHRLVFWPRGKSPVVLLANRNHRHRALFGKIRVYAVSGALAAAHPRQTTGGNRWVGAYWDRPLLPENFGASEAPDADALRSLDDWVTFHQSGRRMAEYLRHVGYGGATVSVLADGSSIYPTELIEPTSRYDTGVFFSTGQDPLRKDVLEMLLRIFDRERLTLVPAISLSGPMPRLERLLARGGSQADGIEPIGADGRSWRERSRETGMIGAIYNPLHPEVRRATLDLVRELVDRYGRHPSFGGIAIQLSSDGYATLPGAEWCMDDHTVAAFSRETGVKIDATGPDRFAARARLLSGPHRDAWLAWRAKKMADLHAEAATIVARGAGGQNKKLYLAASRLFDGRAMQRRLRPSLTQTTSVKQAMLEIGLDPTLYSSQNDAGIVLLRPRRFAPPGARNATSVDARLDEASELDDAALASSTSAALFYHPPLASPLASFDQKGPFAGANSFTWLVSEMSPSQSENRRRFIHEMARTDAVQIFDGGWLATLGQEESLRSTLDLYQQLPAVRFKNLAADLRPVAVRYLVDGERTIVYMANDSPWRASVTMQIAAAPNCRIQSLAPGGEAGNWDPAARDGRWVVPLEGYQLAAVAVIGGRVVEGKATVELDTSAGRELELATAGLTERLARLDSPPMYERLANPSFEAPNQQGRIASWIVSPSKPGVEIGVESRSAADGAAAMRAASSGATCFVVSDWFEAPETGRLAVYVALRTDDAKSQPPLRVGIESRVEGNLEYRWTPVGAAPAKAPLGAEWGQFIFPFDDLPVSADTQLRICFDLVGSGVVHIDDVKTSALYFDPNELRTLSKTVATARFQAQARQWADCADILEGYWPRFLMEHVAPEAPREARAVKPPAVDESATPGVLDRIKQFRPF